MLDAVESFVFDTNQLILGLVALRLALLEETV
jgi:hypothetical protein